MEKNNSLVIALIVVVVFMISLPVMFYLIKDKDKDHNHRDFRRSVVIQPQQPKVVITPEQPQVIVVPTPVIPHDCSKDMYSRGWEDAHHRREPNSIYRSNSDYRRGYFDYYRKHRPSLHFDFGIGFKF